MLENKMVKDLDIIDYQFINDSQDVNEIKCTNNAEGFDSFFVKMKDGEYTEIWGMVGIVPNLYKKVWRLL